MDRGNKAFSRLIKNLNRYLFLPAYGLLLWLLVVVVVDVIGRFFGRPLLGAFEMCELAIGAVVCLTWGHTQMRHRHVAVEVFWERFPPRLKLIIEIFNSFVGLIVAVLLTWAGLRLTLNSFSIGSATQVIQIPLFPFHLLVFLGGLLLCSAFILDIGSYYKNLREGTHGR